VYDILTALGGILNIQWAHNGIVTIGPYCTAQGIIQQIGELGVALSTLVCTAPSLIVLASQTLMYTRPDSHRPYIRSGSVESWD
jgi:hypothetical protein